jgi:hypothetical protein
LKYLARLLRPGETKQERLSHAAGAVWFTSNPTPTMNRVCPDHEGDGASLFDETNACPVMEIRHGKEGSAHLMSLRCRIEKLMRWGEHLDILTG